MTAERDSDHRSGYHDLSSQEKVSRVLGVAIWNKTAEEFIFGQYDSDLSREQKRQFLILVDESIQPLPDDRDRILDIELTPRDRDGKVSPNSAVRDIQSLLDQFVNFGLLELISKTPYLQYSFTEKSGQIIDNYMHVAAIIEGDGRYNLRPIAPFKRSIFNIDTQAKTFLYILMSYHRRLYEDKTGQFAEFKRNDDFDYNERILLRFTYETVSSIIRPGLTFEIIPINANRIRVIAECHHILAEETYNQFLQEVTDIWPETAAEISDSSSQTKGTAELGSFEFNQQGQSVVGQQINIAVMHGNINTGST